ncbi:hypothetical protein [Wolbachia endosymbiont of Pentidionis agamae]|uniref:hypothetical protein n=1 Tax=Wolbachia endosymbiont of Pentidionis agamae TaxID=3110435 RepID=UPI002FCF20D0
MNKIIDILKRPLKALNVQMQKKDHENQVDKKIWKLYVNSLLSDLNSEENKEVVKNIIYNIVKTCNPKKLSEIQKLLNNNRSTEKINKEKPQKKLESILLGIGPKKAFEELSIMEEQAEDFLKNVEENQERNENEVKKLREKIKEQAAEEPSLKSSEIKRIEKISQEQQELSKKFGLSGAALFKETLKYIRSLKELPKVTLLNNTDDNNNIQGYVLPKDLKSEQALIDNKFNHKRELEKIDEINITNSINHIYENKESIFNCKNHQRSKIREKEEHKFRASSCQKMVDIYQDMIEKYQGEIDLALNPVQKILESISQRNQVLSEKCTEVLEILGRLQKEHNELFNRKQKEEMLKLILTFFVDIQSEVYSSLPSTELQDLLKDDNLEHKSRHSIYLKF